MVSFILSQQDSALFFAVEFKHLLPPSEQEDNGVCSCLFSSAQADHCPTEKVALTFVELKAAGRVLES
jgi:hypothetical protein